jgi:hypothetical protein
MPNLAGEGLVSRPSRLARVQTAATTLVRRRKTANRGMCAELVEARGPVPFDRLRAHSVIFWSGQLWIAFA